MECVFIKTDGFCPSILASMLKNKADLRALFFMALTTSVLIANWRLETFSWPLFLLACLLPMPVYVITHNHNHVPIWKNSFMNALQDYWLTLFYGFPTFAWIPTHNENHHTFNNRDGDDTITYRISEKNNLFTLLSYPMVSSSNQMSCIFRFLKKTLKENPKRGIFYVSQIVLLVGFLVGAFVMDWQKALLYIFIPHQIGLCSVLFINYVQHVHADELSRWNHSRNFIGPITNWVMMNNGYHTIHHESPKTHWSLAKAEHEEKIAPHLDPRLSVNLFGYLFTNYILGIFIPKFRTKSMRLERMASEQTKAQKSEQKISSVSTSMDASPAL